MIEPHPVLYVIVRNDIESMLSGKAEAHSGHAASAFAYRELYQNKKVNSLVEDWCESTEQGFGTQINLDGSYETIICIDDFLSKNEESDDGYLVWETVNDPTYPYKCYITNEYKTRKELTAMYVFGMSDNPLIKEALGGLKLKP